MLYGSSAASQHGVFLESWLEESGNGDRRGDEVWSDQRIEKNLSGIMAKLDGPPGNVDLSYASDMMRELHLLIDLHRPLLMIQSRSLLPYPQ